MTHSLKQKLTTPLIAILVIVCLVIGGYFYINKRLSQPVTVKEVKIDTKAAYKLNVLKQISKKSGIKEWELTAASATLLKDENRAVLDKVFVKFFTKDNKEVRLQSQKGELNTKSHDMTFSQNVVVTFEDAVLRTDQLHYNKKKHIIHSDSRVRLDKQDSVIEADSMTTHLDNNKTILKGHVKGLFSEHFKLQ